jgi:Mn-dependent DtxR family transcriptional regulator
LKTYESAENYLETILTLGKAGQSVRSIDVVNELGFSKPSVSIAMKNLREKELIEIDQDGHIILTEVGRQIAESVYERHLLISEWLIHLGVDQETAIKDACKMEHAMSEQSFAVIKNHIDGWKRNNEKS